MSLARFAKKRDATEPAIVDALRRVGVKVWKLDQPFDLLLWSEGRFWLMEVKSPGGGLTPSQKAFMAEFEDEAAVPVYVVKSAEEALQAAAEIGQWR